MLYFKTLFVFYSISKILIVSGCKGKNFQNILLFFLKLFFQDEKNFAKSVVSFDIRRLYHNEQNFVHIFCGIKINTYLCRY